MLHTDLESVKVGDLVAVVFDGITRKYISNHGQVVKITKTQIHVQPEKRPLFKWSKKTNRLVGEKYDFEKLFYTDFAERYVKRSKVLRPHRDGTINLDGRNLRRNNPYL